MNELETIILTQEEKRLLDDGIESLHKYSYQVTVMDIAYLIGFTKLDTMKIFSYCTGHYEVQELKVI